jgi:serine/threonine protein phosphatase PrpC
MCTIESSRFFYDFGTKYEQIVGIDTPTENVRALSAHEMDPELLEELQKPTDHAKATLMRRLAAAYNVPTIAQQRTHHVVRTANNTSNNNDDTMRQQRTVYAQNAPQQQVVTVGLRMEDYGRSQFFENGIFVSVVCDGHGAVALTPTRHIGGYETARYVTEEMVNQLGLLGQQLSLWSCMTGVETVAHASAVKEQQQHTMEAQSRIRDRMTCALSSLMLRHRRRQQQRNDDADAQACRRGMQELLDEFVAVLISQTFIEIQEKLMTQCFDSGAEKIYFLPRNNNQKDRPQRVSLHPEAAFPDMYRAFHRRRRQKLEKNIIDGRHFQDCHIHEDRLRRFQLDKKVVVDKVLLPIPKRRREEEKETVEERQECVFVSCYVNRENDLISELDFGCTCTAAFVLPFYIIQCLEKYLIRMVPSCITAGGMMASANASPLPRLFLAHVGDSDAYLFTEEKPPLRLVAEHNVKNEGEVTRMHAYGVVPSEVYFRIEEAPTPMFRTRGIMPSRTFGHSLFRHYGLISDPHIAAINLHPGDTVVLGTDGLWDERWDAVTEIDTLLRQYHDLDVIGQHLLDTIKERLPFRDNIVFQFLRCQKETGDDDEMDDLFDVE